MATIGHQPAIDARAVYRKISRRLIPYMFLLYILAYLDRVNVGFAAADMKAQLHFSDTVYGLGAGIFFLGSSLFDVPSNLLLQRFGPRRWMARIMISWGIIATCMMLVRTPLSFYSMRLLLGIAEAGFFPGMIFYLTYWVPVAGAGARRGPLHDRDSGGRRRRRAAVQCSAQARWPGRPGRLAMAVSGGGAADRADGHLRAVRA